MVDLALEIGAVTETVEVTASATTVQSETATLGKIVTTKELISALPKDWS